MIQQITWIVIHGKQLWRKLWYPTANVSYNWDLPDGVYKMNIVHNNITYPGMGTFFADRNLLEAHLFDVDIDLYDDEVTIYPILNIRENQTFETLDALIDQIQADEAQVRNISWKVLTFGTFDHAHPGHVSYLTQARNHGDHLITIIALDKTVQKIKWFDPDFNQSQRLQTIQDIWISHHTVQLWDPENVYQCLHDWKPELIYLWYDQHSFDDGIVSYCKKHQLAIPRIVRWDAHKPEKYKSSLMKQQK